MRKEVVANTSLDSRCSSSSASSSSMHNALSSETKAIKGPPPESSSRFDAPAAYLDPFLFLGREREGVGGEG